MPLDPKSVLAQIDAALDKWTQTRALSQYDDLSDLREELPELVTILADVIERFAPRESVYQKEAAISERSPLHARQEVLHGIVKALRRAYASNYLQSVEELIHADMFSDFLEMASHLLGEQYKDAAAVIAGSALEQHLRNLATKAGITLTDAGGRPKKTNLLNDELTKSGVYAKLDQKNVVAWLDLRNKAAHGLYDEYSAAQVELFVQGIRDFFARLPA